jgi:dienelactone hydrolase
MKFILVLFFICVFQLGKAQPILIEAENFENKGGWFVDPQFYDQIGSVYLLAHGNGTPVKNASTHFKVEKPGRYFVYARTRNWVGDWFKEDEYKPGIFHLAINGNELNKSLGNKGKDWAWQFGGEVILNTGDNRCELIDLSGFGARCDAIIFTRNKDEKIINSPKQLAKLRQHLFPATEYRKEYDLIVVGGGIAGLSASISAARQGLKTCLIHNRPVLGGNNIVENSVIVSGKIMQTPYKNIGTIVNEIGNIFKNPEGIGHLIANENNLDVFFNTQATGVLMNGSTIVSVMTKNIENSEQIIFKGKLFADCTGDGTLGYYAGAKYMLGRETRSTFGETLAPEIESDLSYGSTLKWNSTKENHKVDFPKLPWAVQFTDFSCIRVFSGSWNWETGFYKNQIKDAEYIRDYMLRVIYGNWSYLKNTDSTKQQYLNWDLTYVSPILGKRESRRLVGDIVFKQQDIEGEWNKYNDACVIGTYTIDQHFPDSENSIYFPNQEFISNFKHDHFPIGYDVEFKYPEKKNPPYYIPYRCLYSKNIDNLFMAGRNISCSRIAFCSTRLQGTTGMMGEIIGIAAYLCTVNNCNPREIYHKYFDQFKTAIELGVPLTLKDPFQSYLTGKAPQILKDLGEEVHDSIRVRKLVFCSQVIENSAGKDTSMIFAAIARPEKPGHYPGLLVLHGGAGWAETDRAIKWAKKGYVALVLDEPGIADPEKVPFSGGQWKNLPYGGGRFTVQPDISNSTIFEGVLASVQGLYLLHDQPDVITDHIGIVGISWGGYLTTILSGLVNTMICASFSVYGSGFYDEGSTFLKDLNKMSAADRVTWLKYLDAGRRATAIKTPFFIAAATNDNWFYPPAVMATLRATKGQVNHLFSPNSSHKIVLPGGTTVANPEQSGWLSMEQIYFEYFLKDKGFPLPVIEKMSQVKLMKASDSGYIQVRFKVKSPLPIKEAQVIYSQPDVEWTKRNWVIIPVESSDGEWYYAKIPIKGSSMVLDWYANVSDTRPVSVSSYIVRSK